MDPVTLAGLASGTMQGLGAALGSSAEAAARKKQALMEAAARQMQGEQQAAQTIMGGQQRGMQALANYLQGIR